jgi:hypothetical protein
MAQPLKVYVTLTITIENPAHWTTTFGVEGREAIRQDVKEYVGTSAQHLGVFGNGEVDAEISWR